ncbi:EscJ/YscJ/HrcJ family type III secretion inner membrane ring protein, partial [Proteus mirabilis]|nr:EscJ/YscJ/HrcJ family type III secretion inner membrane ring protein [Proteus mirabilis]
MDESNITVLLYPRNINKFTILNNQLHQDNTTSLSNSWLLIGLSVISLIIIIMVILIIYRRKQVNKMVSENE